MSRSGLMLVNMGQLVFTIKLCPVYTEQYDGRMYRQMSAASQNTGIYFRLEKSRVYTGLNITVMILSAFT